jgi:hypothetical protein
LISRDTDDKFRYAREQRKKSEEQGIKSDEQGNKSDHRGSQTPFAIPQPDAASSTGFEARSHVEQRDIWANPTLWR